MGSAIVSPVARRRVTRVPTMTTVSPCSKKLGILHIHLVKDGTHRACPLLVALGTSVLAAPRQVGRLVEHHVIGHGGPQFSKLPASCM